MTSKTPAPQPERPTTKQEASQVKETGAAPLLAFNAHTPLTPRAVLQMQRTMGNRATMRLLQKRTVSPRPATGGGSPLPRTLKAGIESLSGVDMSDVQVHHNSPDAATVDAHAYAQGNQIHLAPGQERHLPHEAWHVVQQKMGRVASTGATPDGRALNDDPALESEADRMGAQALSSPPVLDSHNTSLLTPANAPLQGVFTQKGQWQRGTDGFENAYYIDNDSGARYNFVESGPGDGVVPYFWVSPVDDSSVRIAIRPVPGGTSEWVALSEVERLQADTNAQARGLDRKSPEPKTHPTDFTREMPQINIKPGAFETGESQEYLLQIGHEALKQSYTVSSLVTGFTAQVIVLPTAQGVYREYETLPFGEYAYTSDQIWVQDVAISDERLNTRYGTEQQSHTVSYTLSRNATIALSNRTAREFLEHYIADFEALAPVVDDEAGLLLLKSVRAGNILAAAKEGKLPIDRWQALLSTLIRAFYQIYQLSTAATYKRGKAHYHGESTARKNLEADNDAARDGTPTRNASKMATDAAKMIDLQFRIDSLGLRGYAFAMNHWIDSLKLLYPDLMAASGDAIIAPKINMPLTSSFLEAAKQEQATRTGGVPTPIVTVKDLLEFYDFEPSAVKTIDTYRDMIEVGDVVLPTVDLGRLGSDFTASVSLIPLQTGVVQPMTYNMYDKESQTHNVNAYTAGQLGIHTVVLGNKERPSTKFITSQKSHTVAWTLVRQQMMAFQGKSLADLFVFLDTNLNGLKKDVGTTDGGKVTDKTLHALQANAAKTLPMHEWQALVSALMRWYLIAYSAAESASYLHPKELDRAEGHGEAWCMKVLRRNEYSLASGQKLSDDPSIVKKAATGLMDAYISVRLDAQGVVNAYHHWNTALESAFPTLMQQGGTEIRTAIHGRQVGEGVTFGNLLGIA